MRDINTKNLSDDDLLARVRRTYLRSRELTAHLVRLLVELEERRLHLRAAYSSLFEFCVKHLGMSNGSASRYGTATRLAIRFPQIVDRIERGEVHLSTLLRMREHLTSENVDELLTLAKGKNRYEVEELVAALSPQPDAPSRMRKLPTHRTADSVAPAPRALQPLGEARWRVQFTADRELHDEIEQLRDLMRHTNPHGDLESLFKYCVRAGLERLRKQRFGASAQRSTRTNEQSRPNSRSTAITAAVRRAVFERDGHQCTYRDDDGRRCTCTTFLELDHIKTRAHGGLDTPGNLRVRCRPHNRLYAEDVFGKLHVAARIHARQRERASPSKSDSNGTTNT